MQGLLSFVAPINTQSMLAISRHQSSLFSVHHRPFDSAYKHPLFFSPFLCTKPLANFAIRYSFSPFSLVTDPYAGALLQDAGATVFVLASATGLVFTFDTLTARNVIQQKLSRKLVHILSGLLFMITWPIFSSNSEARYFAAFVPFVNCLRLVVSGLSLTTDERLVKSVTREGNPRELLRGPLFYVVVMILCLIIFWRESPIGMISLSMMCGGDGFADIIGRRFGSQKLPFNQQKSWAGSLAMLVCSFLLSTGVVSYFSVLGFLHLDWTETLHKVALISLVAALVESLPISEVVDDNISVPLAAMAMAYLTFGS